MQHKFLEKVKIATLKKFRAADLVNFYGKALLILSCSLTAIVFLKKVGVFSYYGYIFF